MATAVQIEVSVDSAGVVSGVSQVTQATDLLSSRMQEFGTRANAIWGSLANAPREVQQQFAFLNSQAATLQSNAVAVSQEMTRLNTAMLAAEQSTQGAAAAVSELGAAAEGSVPQMAAASAAVRLLEGNTTGSIRAAERFLSTTLNLGPALQAAFPIFGALAFLGVIEHVADVTSKFFADVFIYSKQAQQDYDLQVAANNRLAGAVEQLKEAEANLFTTTHTTEQNIQHDIDTEIDKRTQLTQSIQQQQKIIQDLQNQQKANAAQAGQFAGDPLGANTAGIIAEQSNQKLSSDIGVAQANLRALQDQAKATDDNIAAGYQKLADQEDAIDQKRLQTAQHNAEVMEEINIKGAQDNLKAWQDYNNQLDEMDKLAGKEQNDMFKQTNEENAAALKQRGADLDHELKDEQRQYQQNEREFQRYTQQLGNDLYQVFNDITSGNIGRLITDGFKRLFANILAQWIATVQGIGNVSNGSVRGGGTGLFASLLGSLFGIGGGGIQTGQSGPYGLPPGVASSFGDFGNAMVLPGGTDILGAAGSLNTSSLSSDITAAAVGGVLSSSPVGPAGSVPQQKPGILGGLLSSASLTKLAPLVLLSSLLLGSKGGSSAIAGGALIGSLGLAALYGPNAALTSAVAPFAGLLGPLAGGLIGFGVGTLTGSPTLGALSGAASGAGIGFLAGGPIGAAIGGIIGGLVGLFSGLFGGGPSKHTLADRYINANILPAIKQELTGYEGFQIDYTSAINTLDQMKQQSFDTLHQQFGKDAATDEWNRLVVPAITQAEQTINTDEAERQRRQGLLFGPPQFADGGIFSTSGSAGMAILHDGETVMTRAATQLFGASTLLAMNSIAGKSPLHLLSGSGSVHIHIHTLDTKTMTTWLRQGGSQMIASALGRDRMEGR